MKLDLSKTINDENGDIIKDRHNKILPLYHFVRLAVMQPLQDDPPNIEHSRKLQAIFAKLERAKAEKIVEFKTETITFIRDRMLKCKMHLLIMSAFELVAEGGLSESALDTV